MGINQSWDIEDVLHCTVGNVFPISVIQVKWLLQTEICFIIERYFTPQTEGQRWFRPTVLAHVHTVLGGKNKHTNTESTSKAHAHDESMEAHVCLHTHTHAHTVYAYTWRWCKSARDKVTYRKRETLTAGETLTQRRKNSVSQRQADRANKEIHRDTSR